MCEKAERVLRNTAINDACRKSLLRKEIHTCRTILQRAYPLEYEETANFIDKQFERHEEKNLIQDDKIKKHESFFNRESHFGRLTEFLCTQLLKICQQI